MARLSTHVLDTAHGKPAEGVAVTLYTLADPQQPQVIARTVTNADGRTDQPLLSGDVIATGRYRLVFAAGDYFRRLGMSLPDPAFADVVTLDFGIADAAGHYHVPLLVSPWSWSTYRGS